MTVLNWYRAKIEALKLAQHDAVLLRAKYGSDAEHWVEIGLAHPDPSHRKLYRDIATALRGLPA